MPNRKIKHIVAKLVGASTEETLDVYDIDAVHTSDVVNNLTTTNAGYVLDARQGKALNDSLSAFLPNAWTSGVNMNNLTTPGIYMLSTSITNSPVNDHPWSPVIVFGSNGSFRQIMILTDMTTWVRVYDSVWKAWTKL